MRPILLKGHERPLTFIKYNREGDLVFTCAKDHHPTLWYSDDGERVGTYIGHNGAVWTCDITGACSRDATVFALLSGSALADDRDATSVAATRARTTPVSASLNRHPDVVHVSSPKSLPLALYARR